MTNDRSGWIARRRRRRLVADLFLGAVAVIGCIGTVIMVPEVRTFLGLRIEEPVKPAIRPLPNGQSGSSSATTPRPTVRVVGQEPTRHPKPSSSNPESPAVETGAVSPENKPLLAEPDLAPDTQDRQTASPHVELFYVAVVEPMADQVAERLRGLGISVSVNQTLVSPDLRYNHAFYGGCTENLVRSLKNQLKDLVRLTLMRSSDPCPSSIQIFILA